MLVSLLRFKKSPLLWLYLAGAILLIGSGALWWMKLSVAPDRVFWDTVEQSLSTSSVTIHAEQDNGQTHVRQFTQYSLGSSNITRTFTTLSQGNTVVQNELIGTPQVDYTRYASIKTDQKRANGSKLDFSKIVGVWAKGEQGSSRLFSQSVLGTSLPLGGMGVPIGNVQAGKRAQLMQQLRRDVVYQVSFKKVKKEHKSGRYLYTYDVTLQPVAYAALMKEFAKDIGLRDLDQLDPKSFVGQKPLPLTITIDVRAHHLAHITVPDAQYSQSYSSYDVPVRVDPPKQTITSAKLQELLSNLQ